MNKLKIKFSVFERRLAMQVMEQSVDITGSFTKPLDFKATNGIVVTSNSKPGIYPELNQLNIRGSEKIHDLDVVYARFKSTEEAIDFMNKVKVAVAELFESINSIEINRLSSCIGEVIELPNCKVLINTIQGSYIFQLISSNFSKSPSAKVFNNDVLNIKFDPDSGENVEIHMPLRSESASTCLLNISKLTKEQGEKLINEIIYNLSGISSNTVIDDKNVDNEYPNYYLYSS